MKQSDEREKEQSTDLEESLKALKNYNPQEFYLENTYVDALDSYSSWRVAKILEIKDNIAKVNFDGWSHKWDEQISIRGSKIAPFKKYTPPYTGASKAAIRDFELENARESITKCIEQMEHIAKEGFLINSPYYVTQTIRGDLYILIDSVLSISNPVRGPKDLKLISSLLEKFVEFFVKFLECTPNYLKEYTDGRTVNQHLFLVNDKIAAVSCFAEMFDTMNKLFGGVQRCLKLYQSSDFPLQQFTQTFANKPRDRSSAYQNQAVNLINYFGQLGGFEKLLQLLKWEFKVKESAKAKGENEKEGTLRLPIHLYKFLIQLIQPLSRLLTPGIRDKFFGEFKSLFFSRMEKITPKEMKENETYGALAFIRDSTLIFEEIYGKEAWTFTEQAELDFTVKMLRCPFLERKIKALGELKDFIERADPTIDARKLGERRQLRYITQEKLKNWIIQQQIVEYLFGDETHVELIKRSSVILGFLCQMNGLSNEHLNLIWKSTEGKYEDYILAIYDTITELSGVMSVEALEFMFSKMVMVPVEEYTEVTVSLIKEFSLKAMNTLTSAMSGSYFKAKKTINPKYEYFGLKIFWDGIQDNSKLDPKLFPLVFDGCIKLLKNTNFKNEKEKYLGLCFDNLKAGHSVPQSLLLSLHILTTFSGSGLFSIGNSLEDILGKFNSKYNLIEATVVDAENYMAEVTKAYEKLKAKNALSENPIYVGKNPHSYHIDQRLLFIENINGTLKKPELTFTHIKRLWNIFVKSAVSELETTTFLQWITKYKENSSKQKTYILGSPLLKQIYSNILCNQQMMDNFTNISLEIFKCFEKLFVFINEKEEYLEIAKSGSYRVYKFDQLIGVEYLWQILLNCTNEEVLKSLKHLLVTLHLRIAGSNMDPKLATWQSFVEKCLESLQIGAAKKNLSITLNAITVLHSFIVNFEGRKYLTKDSPSSEKTSLLVGIRNDESQKKVVVLPSNATLYYLRKKISEEFNLPVYDFEMTLKNNFKISHEIEEEYCVTAIDTTKEKGEDRDVIVTPKSSQSAISVTKDKFKVLLSSNQKLMDILFDLLSSSNFKVAKDTWELLSILPQSKSLKTYFEKLSIGSEDVWFSLLELSCSRKFLYTLQILCEICLPANGEGSKKESWCREFIDKKGFQHLLKLFDKFSISELTTSFPIRSMALLVRLMGFFIENYNDKIQLEKSKTNPIREILAKLLQGLLAVTTEPFNEKDPSNESERVRANEEFVRYSFGTILTLLKLDPTLLNDIYNFPELRKLILKGLIESPDTRLREDIASNLATIAGTSFPTKEAQKPNIFLLALLIDHHMKVIAEYRDKCEQYFKLVENLYSRSTQQDLESTKIDFKELALSIASRISKLEPYEVTSVGDKDYLLQGYMRLLEALFRRYPGLKNSVLEQNNKFVIELLHSCLFEIPDDYSSGAVVSPPKCKSTESRKAAFQLLYTLTNELHENLTEAAVEYLVQPLRRNFWRTGARSDWFIFPLQGEKSRTGYVGLKNLGCTCYMNSLMQQFFMLPAFRDSILETENVNVKIEDHENLLMQFQLILGSLKRSQKQYYDPRSFCLAFKDYEGKPINVIEQMDVDEFFNNLLDKLEPYLKDTKNEGIIKRNFGGMLSNQLICKGCPHSSEREEPCLAISLKVKNKKTIYEGLENFIEGEMLEGDNAYHCDKCEKKVSTLKRVCIKTLPNILILVLKRFEFDFDTMQKMKVNDYCEFPHNLDMRPYTQGYLRRKEKEESGEALDENDAADQAFPPQYYEYKLRGVVIHMGTSESGHYYSLIKDGKDNWFEFNDNTVTLFDVNDLPYEAYGGEEKISVGNLGNSTKLPKSKNAYLLFYERVTYFDENGKSIRSLSMNDGAETSKALDVIQPKILQEIRNDNFKFQMTKYMFDREFSETLQRILKFNVNGATFQGKPPASVISLGKLAILYFMTVLLRAQDRDRLPQFLREVKKAISTHYELAHWFINAFREREIIKEFLVACAVPDMKYFTVGLIKTALERVYERDSQGTYDEFKKLSIIVPFINSFVYVLYECEEQYKMMAKFFEVFSLLTGLGIYVKNYFVEQRMIARLAYTIIREKLPANSYKDYKEVFDTQSIKPEDGLGMVTQEDTSKKHLELIKSVAEMIDKKREMSRLEGLAVNFNMLVATVAKLGLSIIMPGMVTDDPNFIRVPFEETERTILTSMMVCKALLRSATTKYSRQLISSLIAHVSFKRESLTADFFKMLKLELGDKDDQALRVYLLTLEKLMRVKDGLEAMRLEKGMQCLVETLTENAAYYRATEICIDYFFKMCSRNPSVLKYASESKSLMKFLESWIKDFSNPLSGFTSQKLKLFKSRQATLSSQMLQQNSSKFVAKREERQAKLKKVSKKDADGLVPDYDSDEDYSQHKFEINEKLDYNTDGYNWVGAYVIQNLDEMIQIKTPEQTVWIYVDDDKICPYSKAQLHYKNEVEFWR